MRELTMKKENPKTDEMKCGRDASCENKNGTIHIEKKKRPQ
jgi:hypothetical protein